MTAILKKWLSLRLNIQLKWTPEEFGMAVRDGTIISKLLQSYNLITREQCDTVIKSTEHYQIKNNLAKIKEWLKNINIELSPDDVRMIAEGKGSFSLGLFYQIFLELDDKSKLYFTAKKMKESEKTVNQNITSNADDKTARSENSKDSAEPESVLSCESNFVLADLRNFEISKNQKSSMKMVKSSLLNFEEQDERAVLEKMSRRYVQKQNEIVAAKRFLELSRHEKQLANELLMAKREAELVIRSRQRQQETIATKRELEFSKALDDLKNEMKKQAVQLELEKDILNILNKRLDSIDNLDDYYESLKICKETALALFDFACIIIDFKKLSTQDLIPEMYTSMWKNMFIYDKFNSKDEIEEISDETLADSSILDEAELDDYIDRRNAWNTNSLDDNDGCKKLETISNIILGYIIKRVSSQKVEIQDDTKTETPLPMKDVRGVILSSNNLRENKQFIELLKKKHIRPVTINESFQYCLEQFKKELIDFDEMTANFEEFEARLRGTSVVTKDSSKSSDLSFGDGEVRMVNRPSQTPSKLPTADKYSDSAQLGKLVYESIKDDVISDDLISSVIVNFVKHRSDKKGWVLFDYPENHKEAIVLEEKLSGKTFSKSLSLQNLVAKDKNRSVDETANVFKSKIIPIPEDKVADEEFQSFFTSFLKLKLSQCIENEDFIMKLTDANSTGMERIYADQGIYFMIYYESLDTDTFSCIMEYLTRETNEVSFNTKLFSNEEQVLQTKVIHLKTEVVPDSNVASETELSKNSSTQLQEDDADESKFFTDHNLPETVSDMIKSYWELLESTYINNLKELFATKRNSITNLSLYMTYVKKAFINIDPDYSLMQDIVENLQNNLECNGDKALLQNGRARSEKYSKIDRSRTELKSLLQNKIVEYDTIRKDLINDDWVTINMCETTNLFVNFIQIEINRSHNTLKMICDYYSAILNYPTLKNEFKLILLPKLTVDKMVDYVAKDEAESIPEFIRNKLFVNDEILSEENPFVQFINQTKSSVDEYVAMMQTFYSDIIEKEKIKSAKLAKTGKAKPSVSQAQATTVGKIVSCIIEWENVLKGEICRIKRQILLIQQTSVKQLNQIERFVFKTFFDIHHKIMETFEKDCRIVDMICDLFTLSVDKQINVPTKILFKRENVKDDIDNATKYIVEKDSLKYEQMCGFCVGLLAGLHEKFMGITKYCSIPKDLMIIVLQDYFLLNDGRHQKNNCKWNLLEPNEFVLIVEEVYGIMDYVDWRDFILLCLDITFPSEDELLSLKESFLKFDTKQTETIARDDYYDVKLWFEPEEGCSDRRYNLRSCLVKELLFLLYEIDYNIMNYSGLLLACCRSEIPTKGFVKALNLVIGRRICDDSEKIQRFMKRCQNEKYLREKSRESAMSFADFLVDEMVDRVVRECSGVVITDVITPKGSSECFLKKYVTDPEEKEVKRTSGNCKTPKASKDSLKSTKNRSSKGSGRKSSKTNSGALQSKTSLKEIDSEQDVDLVFTVSENVVRKVLLASLPWHCQAEFAPPYSYIIGEVQRIFCELKYDSLTDNVFVEQLINHEALKDIVNKSSKFKIFKPCRTAAELIYDKCNIII